MFFSSGPGKKPGAGSSQAKREMVQVDRSDSASPFWRAPQRNETPPPAAAPGTTSSLHSRDSSLVVGASYSHADMLRIDSLGISGSSSGPRTPPSARTTSTSAARTHDTPPVPKPGSRSGLASPPFKTYMTFLSRTNEDWNVDDTADAMYGDYGADDDDDDGDDFGLPSLSNMKRKTRRLAEAAAAAQQAQNPKPQPGILAASKSLDDAAGGEGQGEVSLGGLVPRRRSNSADIAIERPVPGYPVPKKSEGKILRPQYKDILCDPANALHLIHHAVPPAEANQKEIDAMNSRITRINKFKKILQASAIPLTDLRALAWGGVPEEVRAMTWQLLLGYLPTSSERRVATLERKRKEYLDGVRQAFDRGGGVAGSGVGGNNIGPTSASTAEGGAGGGGGARGRGLDEAVWHQISIDVPRTNPHIELYSYEATQRSLERILYVWAVRHPASGYVQGINDLVTPFWQVFLGTYITDPNIESGMDPGQLPRPVLDAVEADSFWCLSKLLDGIQDHYIVAQPGIQRQVAALRDLTARIDSSLAQHLEKEHVEFIQFSFRWMNCLLMREISVNNTIRMWDTYMAEEQGFSEFHLYVCAAFLVKWSAKLVKMDFQEIMMFLQSLPTRDWTEKDIELLLSEAYIWQSLFKGSSAHLRGPGGNRTASSAAPLQL